MNVFLNRLLCSIVVITMFNLRSQAQAILVEDIFDGTTTSFPQYITIHEDTLFFAARDETGQGRELWKHDGTTGTMAANINPGAGQSEPRHLISYKNTLIFGATDGTTGRELWRYDNGATTMVMDINPLGDSDPSDFAIYHDTLYFSADDGVNGRELWMYDGDTAMMIVNIDGGAGSSSPTNLLVYNDTLYLVADDNAAAGNELRKLSGDTVLLAWDIRSGASNGDPNYLTIFEGNLYFGATSTPVGPGNLGKELHRFDGDTLEMVQDIFVGSNGSDPWNLTVVEDRIFFQAINDVSTGREFFVYDGDSAYMISDIRPGSLSSFPQHMISFNQSLFFQANDGTGGKLMEYREDTLIWVLDTNSNPIYNPQYPVIWNDVLYFNGDDGVVGGEIWKFTPLCTQTSYSYSEMACDSFTVPSGDSTYSVVGSQMIMDVIPNSCGYDSVLTINLTLDTSYTSILDTNLILGDSLLVSGGFIDTTGQYIILDSSGQCLHTITVNVTLINPAGIDESTIGSLVVYPNPVSNELIFEAEEQIKSIRITNASGVELINVSTGSSKVVLSTSHLATGLYIFEVSDETGSSQRGKLIKE